MKRTPLMTAMSALLCLAANGIAHAQAGNAYYQILNLTASPGDTVFSVNSDVTFTDLSLTEVFSSGKRFKVTLPQPSVDTGLIELDSSFFSNPDPSYGSVTLATLNGIFDNGLGTAPYQIGDTESFDIANSFGAATTPANVYADFTASLVNPDPNSPLTTVNIYAFDADTPGTTYAAGQFSLVNTAPAPEPSPLALLGLGGLGLGVLGVVARRRNANSAVSHSEGEVPCA